MQTDVAGVIIGVAGIAIGILASYYFYRKSIRTKEPCWAIRSNNLIQGYRSKLSDLQVLYKQEGVENLTISKVIFWNNGGETIDRQDIMTANRISVVGVGSVKLLDAKLLVANNSSSQFSVQLADDRSYALLDFDYLDNKQGAVLQLVHSGTSSDDIAVTGDIKGVRALRRRLLAPVWATFLRKRTPSGLKRLSPKLVFSFAIGAGIAYTVVGLAGLFVPSASRLAVLSSPRYTWFSDAIFAALGVLLLVMGIDLWRRSSFAPRGLELFDEMEP